MQPVAQALALHERHHVVGGAAHLAAVDQAEDVGVLQGRDRADLPHEPLGADHGGELGAEDLDGDLALVAEVLGEVHGGHAALAELALDPIAVGEGRAEEVEGGGRHTVGWTRATPPQTSGRSTRCAKPRADFGWPGRSMVPA